MIAGDGKTIKKKTKFTLDDLQLFFLSLPTLVWYLLFCYLPMFGLIIAFKKYKVAPGKGFLYSLFNNSAWCGFENFQFLFANNKETTFNMFRNTIGYNIVFIVLGVVLPVTLAIMISHLHSQKVAKVTQTAMFLPHFLSWVVVGYFVFAFLSTDNGFLNKSVLHSSINWYMTPKYWPVILVLVNLWKTFGYNSILYYATVIGIDSSLYEAAVMDGANRWQKIRHVTLPALKPTVITLTLLAVGRVMYSDFGLFYQVPQNSGLLYDVTTTIDVYVYKSLIVLNDVGRSAAAGFFQSICGFILVLAANWVVSRIDRDNALF